MTHDTHTNPVEHAQFLLSKGRSADALTLVRNADPDDTPARRVLARTLMALGRHDEAAPILKTLLDADPSDGFARQHLAAIERSLEGPPPIEGERSYHTSIPREFLLGIQNALHRFSYAGLPMLKNPFDLAIYAKLVHDVRPGLILELGSKTGASALWFAHQCDSFGLRTKIVSVDVVGVTEVSHDRVTYLEGDARKLDEVLPARGFDDAALHRFPKPWIVIDDADHAYRTSQAIAEWCEPRLVPGDYLVVEDGIISDLVPEAHPGCTSGPHRAIREVLDTDPPAYEIDATYCDMFGVNVTWCTNGFLRRIR
ncbi:MAG: CmcI family methyltransferase [Planctomycetota bacterium]